MNNNVAYTAGQALANRAISANKRSAVMQYFLDGTDLFARFNMGGQEVDILQEAPNAADVKAFLVHKHNFRAHAVTRQTIESFQKGYISSFITHVMTHDRQNKA